MITVMALAMCASLVLGFTLVSRPSAKVSADYTTPTTFEMLGMSIRYSAAEGDDGIRFGVKLDLATYNELKSDDNAVAGILVAPTDKLTSSSIVGKPLNLWNASGSQAAYGVLYSGSSAKNYWTVDGDYAYGIVYLHGFPEASYNRPITAVAYIDWDNDSAEAKMKYSDTVEVSMADVALAVINDYNGSNTYGTTSDQATRLGDYVLDYNVRFLDAYNNVVDTQSVRFGSELDVPEYTPAARTGYTHIGWCEKNGASSYATSATNFAAANAKKVKYARTFRAGFNKTGNTFEKPALSSSNPKYIADGANISKTVSDGELALRGGYYMDGITVANGADFMVRMTFTAVANGEYVFMITDDLANGRGRITFKNNKFNFYNYTSGTYDDKTWAWYDSIEQRANNTSALTAGTEYTMSLIHKSNKYYVFIGDYKAVEFSESESLQSGSSKTVAELVGDGETLYLGIGSISHETTVSDWRFTTDSDAIASYFAVRNNKTAMDTRFNVTPTKLEVSASGADIVTNGNSITTAFFTDVEIAQDQDFVIYATINSGFNANGIGFVVGTNTSNTKHLLIQWRSDRIVFWRQDGGWTGYDDNQWTPGYGNNSTAKSIALVYKSGRYYLYMNGTRVFNQSETADVGWGTVIRTKVGTDDTKKIGLAINNGNMTVSDWGFSTDQDDIADVLGGYFNPAMDARINQTPTTFNVTNTSATMGINTNKNVTAFFTGVELAQDQNFVIWADVNSSFADNIGFVVGTNTANNKHLLFQWRANDIYLWRDINWTGHDDNKWTPGYGNKNSNVKIAMVYKNGYYYMFFNGVQKAKIDETANTGWGMVPKNAVGTDDTKKIGLSFFNGNMNCTAWGYSTDATFISTYYPVS